MQSVKVGTIIESSSVTNVNNVEFLKTEPKSVAVYKPRGNAFEMHALVPPKPQMVIKNFKGHRTIWSYDASICTRGSQCIG